MTVDPGLYTRKPGDPISLPSWSCHECEATGQAWSPRLAYVALVAHYLDEHLDGADDA